MARPRTDDAELAPGIGRGVSNKLGDGGWFWGPNASPGDGGELVVPSSAMETNSQRPDHDFLPNTTILARSRPRGTDCTPLCQPWATERAANLPTRSEFAVHLLCCCLNLGECHPPAGLATPALARSSSLTLTNHSRVMRACTLFLWQDSEARCFRMVGMVVRLCARQMLRARPLIVLLTLASHPGLPQRASLLSPPIPWDGHHYARARKPTGSRSSPSRIAQGASSKR